MANTTLTIIKTDGTITNKEFEGTVPNYKELQAAVGGYIETVPYFTQYHGVECVAFCNEEGKFDGLPLNRDAQVCWEQALGRTIADDHLVGDIAVVWGDQDLIRNRL